MTDRWICSDHHFYHERILEFCAEQRPFDTVEEMHEVMIERHNSLIKPKDHVFFVGDVVFGDPVAHLPIVERLNGIKHLIGGNHDKLRSQMAEYQKYFVSVEAYREFGHNKDIVSHYPVHPQQLEERYKFNVHGHLHDIVLDDPRYINICLDNRDLYPTNLEQVYAEYKDNC